MILKYKSKLLSSLLIALVIVVTGCDGTATLPEVGPEVVTQQFYDLITEAKIKGGASPAKEAYKLIDSDTANLNIHQFLEIVKHYPPGFMVDVGKAEINGTQAVVAINYRMQSSFGGTYTVKGKLPLNIDKDSNRWKVDFTGDSYGMKKDEFMAIKPESSH